MRVWPTTREDPGSGRPLPTMAGTHPQDVPVHRLLLELIPGGAKKDLSAAQAKALLATVRRVMPAERLGAGSRPNWSPTSSGSISARRPRTRS